MASSPEASLRLKGKRAIVLGGTSGIGLATCRLLVEAGCDVMAYSRSKEKVAAAVDSINCEGGGIFSAKSLDILDRDALESEFESNKGFNYLVCAATGGTRAIGPFMKMDLDGFQNSFAKLWGYSNAVRLGTDRMDENGAIVLVSGSPAKRCGPGQIALSCVGGAVENLVKGVAPEISPRRICGVSPGVIDTPMFDGMGNKKDEFLKSRTAANPIKRPGKSDEVAQAILLALENEFMTGTVIDVDGGIPLA